MIAVLVKASLVIVVLLAFYKIFLETESFFAANRIYLLACLVIACTFPFLVLPKLVEHQGIVATLIEPFEGKEAIAREGAILPVEKLNSPQETASSNVEEKDSKTSPEKTSSLSEPHTTVEPQDLVDNRLAADVLTAESQQQEKGFAYWLILFYSFGVAILSLKLLAQVAHTFWKIYKHEDKIEDKGGVLVNMKGDVEPCSFFKYIFINPTSYDYDTYEQIIAHEKIHVKQGHTIDLLLAELAVIVLWFNPFIWVLRREVEKNIEYQTDDLMVKREEKENYQLNLVKIATSTQPLAITTNYNQSLIKQRILKMNAKKSNPYSYWKYSFIAPVLFMLLLFLNKPHVGNAQTPTLLTISETTPDIALEPNDLVATSIIDVSQEESITDQDDGATAEATTTPEIEKPKEEEATEESITEAIDDCGKLNKAVREQNIAAIKTLLRTVDPNCVEPPTPGFIVIGTRSGRKLKANTPLTTAARLGNLEIAKLLVDAGAKVELYDGSAGDGSPLMEASNEGHLDCVKFLVKKGADINVITHNEGSALQRAASGGYLDVVSYLLEEGADINAQKLGRGTPLNNAAKNGHTGMVAFLLDKGADINLSNDWHGSALHAAAQNGHYETVELMISRGADINAQNDAEGSALTAAARKGYNEILELLLSKGADIDPQKDGQISALFAAAWYGHNKTVNLLLSKGANIDLQNGERGTALIVAARNGHTKTVELLLTKGAKIDLQTEEQGTALNKTSKLLFFNQTIKHVETDAQCTALHGAAKHGHNEIVNLLLSKGANIDLQTNAQGTALNAAARNGHVETVEWLLSKGANIDLQNEEQGTPLNAAARNGHTETVEWLLLKGANINLQTNTQGTTLNAAARNGHYRTVELLLSKGADVNTQNDGQGSALNAAARNGQNKIVELLLSKGADINAKHDRQGSALNAAARNGHLTTVELLVSKGADVHLRSEGEGTALVAAYRNAHQHIVKYLESKGAKHLNED